jgi:hypothetical protein
MNGMFCAALAYCFNVEEINLCRDKHVGDDGIAHLSKGDIKLEGGGT